MRLAFENASTHIEAMHDGKWHRSSMYTDKILLKFITLSSHDGQCIKDISSLRTIHRHLSKLTTNSTSSELLGVAVSEEATGVGNDLADVEASSLVSTSHGVVDANEEGSGQAAVGDTAAVRSLGVGEGKTRWAGGALLALVDMCGCDGGRHVLASYTGECDVLRLC
jgi:hypothetical protein